MTNQQIFAAVANMQRKANVGYWAAPIMQLPNGKWHHRFDTKREWSERDFCEMDYQFACQHQGVSP